MLDVIYTSLAGMNAYQNGLGTISNNVANMNTPGFKLSSPLFRDLVNQFGNALGSTGDESKGGGVSADQNALSMQQGTFQDTGNSLSAAIDGAGFFIVDQNGERLYTRAGQFQFNKDGILVETGTQAKVLMNTDTTGQGFFDVNSVRVFPPKGTTTVNLSGALARAAVGSTASSYTLPQIQINDTTGATMNLSAKFSPTSNSPASATTNVSLTGTLTRPTGIGSTPYTSPEINIFDASGTSIAVTARFTPDDIDPLHWTVDILDSSGTVEGSGDLRFDSDGKPVAGSSSITVPIKPASGSAFNVVFDFGTPGTSGGITSPASGTPGVPGVPGLPGGTSSVRVQLQDGAAAVVSDPLHWKVDILDSNNVVQGSGDIKFNNDGTPATDHSSFKVTIKPASGQSFDVTFDFGAAGTFAGVTSVNGTTASQLQVLKQDGVALGTITANTFDDHGRLTLTYSNGQTKTVATLALARFDTPAQLKEVGNAHFVAIGGQMPVMGTPLSEGFGNIAAGKIEMSNVDLTDQFTQLIIVQRGFQGSSQCTSVANDMLQQLLTMASGK